MLADLLFRSAHAPVACYGLGLLILAGCDARPARVPVATVPALGHVQPAQPDEVAAAPPVAAPAEVTPPAQAVSPPIKLKIEPGKPPYRMLPGKIMRYHRYVGRLGSQPVVVEVLANPEKYDMTEPLSGSYYDARKGKTTDLSFAVFNPRQRLQFKAFPPEDSTEHWQAQQPLGPSLTGTVTAAGKPSRHFALREDYQGAVPLVIRTATMYGRPVVAEFGDQGEPGQFTGSYRYQYVQLLGSAAQRPELQRAFPSRPAQVRAHLRREFRQGEGDLANMEDYMGITLNDYGILGYSKYISDFGAGASHPQNIYKSWSYDLHTGRRITLASLFKPGSRPALLQLALHYMDPSYLADIQEWYDNPQQGAEGLTYLNLEEVFGLSPAGLTLDADLGPHAMGPTTITIPYAALRPLLRPGTPLNRVLVAQGLPPVR
jgi:hypothetical protein